MGVDRWVAAVVVVPTVAAEVKVAAQVAARSGMAQEAAAECVVALVATWAARARSSTHRVTYMRDSRSPRVRCTTSMSHGTGRM